MPPGQQVEVPKSASFVDILEVCKFTTFCDRKGYGCIWTSGMFWLVSKAILAVLTRFEAILYADHVRFHSGHPYMDRLPMV